MRLGRTSRLDSARGNKHVLRPVRQQGYEMNAIRRLLLPILWTMSMMAGAPWVWSAGKADVPDAVSSSPSTENVPEVPRASSAGMDPEIIMRRVRVVIEELKRQGPPPVDCMEG